MPTYEYLCQSCGTRFEAWQKMTDDPFTTCRTCGGPVRRVLYPAGIVFKGGGFYSTDHRSSSGRTESQPTAEAGHKSEKSEKTDTKSTEATSGAGSTPTGSSASE
ncbi:MAG: zinc ribbon domain-containing protein [Ktedonobacterales bacterium]